MTAFYEHYKEDYISMMQMIKEKELSKDILPQYVDDLLYEYYEVIGERARRHEAAMEEQRKIRNERYKEQDLVEQPPENQFTGTRKPAPAPIPSPAHTGNPLFKSPQGPAIELKPATPVEVTPPHVEIPSKPRIAYGPVNHRTTPVEPKPVEAPKPSVGVVHFLLEELENETEESKEDIEGSGDGVPMQATAGTSGSDSGSATKEVVPDKTIPFQVDLDLF
jgi:hypothetical protein